MLHMRFSNCDGCSEPKNGFWKLQDQSKLSRKGFKIPPKSNCKGVKSSCKAIVVQRTPLNLHFFKNYQLFNEFRTSKWIQNRRKNPSKSILENNIFLKTTFNRIFIVLASKNQSQINVFSPLFLIRGFSEN